MDEVTQQNAALVEEAAAAAASLEEQTSHLTQSISVFRTELAVSPQTTRRASQGQAAPQRLSVPREALRLTT